jgi:carboxypeptidase family protein
MRSDHHCAHSAARRGRYGLALVLTGLVVSGCPMPAHHVATLGGGIHGHVEVMLRPEQATAVVHSISIELPGAAVTATNVTTRASTNPVPTNAHGYFQIPQLPPGIYQVCAAAPGFTPACLPGNVTIGDSTEVLPAPLVLPANQNALAGQVHLNDKQRTPCFADRPAFHTYVTAKVVLEDAAHNVVAGPVDGNGVGQFVLPAVKVPPGAYEIVATCQAAEARVAIAAPVGDSYTDVAIPNAPPSIDRIEATVGGQAARLIPPGSTAKLHAVANDPDGNSLTFQWADSSKPVAGALATIDYPVPSPSSTTISVQASDGRGGFAWAMIPVTGGATRPALIAGTVVDSDTGAAIPGAQIIINSKPTASDSSGRFSLFVDPAARYSISVIKHEYALLSKATYAPAAELRLPLVHLVATPFDAGKGGTLVPGERNKASNPIQLILAPDSLADSSSVPYTGPGKAYLWGYPKDTPIPGDMTGTFQGKQSQLETFGAAFIELTDMADQPLRLRSLAQATLTIKPTGAAPPPTIPLFIFEDATGIWREHGTLQLDATGAYSGTVTHLSAFNADLAIGTTGCIEYHVDASRSPAFPFYLHLVQGGQTANHEPFQVADFQGVVSRLRPGTPVDWYALPTPTSSLAEAIGHGTITTSTFVNNTGDPDNDYQLVGSGNCTIFTILADFPPNETWLTGLPGSPGAETGADETDYQGAADTWAGGDHSNFARFLETNHFADGGEASAVYFNNADLKLGRDMHCRKRSDNVIACYVSNYLDGMAPPGTAAIVLQTTANAHAHPGTVTPFATVAMEWKPDTTSDGIATSVQFWAYNGQGDRLTEALLDSEGAKPIPQICTACHGGSYSATDRLVHGARFLPFDIVSFKTVDDVFSPDTVNALGLDAVTRTNQLEQFRRLNALVVETEVNHPDPNAARQLVTGWYQGCGGVTDAACGTCLGGATCPTSFNGNFRPPLWDDTPGHRDVYDKVVRVSCRGCHIEQGAGFDWTDPAQMTGTFQPAIARDVCTGPSAPTNVQRRMPHAEVPFKAFWESPEAPGLLRDLLGIAACNR